MKNEILLETCQDIWMKIYDAILREELKDARLLVLRLEMALMLQGD